MSIRDAFIATGAECILGRIAHSRSQQNVGGETRTCDREGMCETVRPVAWKAWQTQIYKLSRTEQEVTGPLELKYDGLRRDLGATSKSA